jgi:hypothetical protein
MSRAMVGMIDRGELCGVRSDDGCQSRGWRSGLAGTQLASTQRENTLRDPSASGWTLADGQRPHSAEDDRGRAETSNVRDRAISARSEAFRRAAAGLYVTARVDGFYRGRFESRAADARGSSLCVVY